MDKTFYIYKENYTKKYRFWDKKIVNRFWDKNIVNLLVWLEFGIDYKHNYRTDRIFMVHFKESV